MHLSASSSAAAAQLPAWCKRVRGETCCSSKQYPYVTSYETSDYPKLMKPEIRQAVESIDPSTLPIYSQQQHQFPQMSYQPNYQLQRENSPSPASCYVTQPSPGQASPHSLYQPSQPYVVSYASSSSSGMSPGRMSSASSVQSPQSASLYEADSPDPKTTHIDDGFAVAMSGTLIRPGSINYRPISLQNLIVDKLNYITPL